jgi:hypothetical protein
VEKPTDVRNASTHRQTNASPATSPTQREVSADVLAIEADDTQGWRRRLWMTRCLERWCSWKKGGDASWRFSN